jgi:hypothetical protein
MVFLRLKVENSASSPKWFSVNIVTYTGTTYRVSTGLENPVLKSLNWEKPGLESP